MTVETKPGFRVNHPHVVCETIDGEVIIVNLEKGYYYSLLGTGATVWSKILEQTDADRVIQEMSQDYEGGAEEITTAIDEFFNHLQQEELIVSVSDLPVDQTLIPPVERSNVPNKPHFKKPILEKFSDMADLLLLDPIHEVDVEAGWPNAKNT